MISLSARQPWRTDRATNPAQQSRSYTTAGDTIRQGSPVQAVAATPHEALRTLLTAPRPATTDEKRRACKRWGQLKAENAPFRIIKETGLSSVGDAYFDPWLMECVSTDWQKMARVIGNALGAHRKSSEKKALIPCRTSKDQDQRPLVQPDEVAGAALVVSLFATLPQCSTERAQARMAWCSSPAGDRRR